MSGPEVLFYHLERATLETVLPGLLEKTRARNWKALVVTGAGAPLDALDVTLWTYRDDSFLPHASVPASQDPTLETILLDDGDDTVRTPLNGADVLFVVGGADIAPDAFSAFARIVVIFDGRVQETLDRARAYWKTIKAIEPPLDLTYWQQGDGGRWEKKA
ncbi:MAG: DNA polymerase III subunit chi [Pseudomonadota bacterium]